MLQLQNLFKFFSLVLVCGMLSLSAHAGAAFTVDEVEYFQPPIVVSTAPERPITHYSVFNNTVRVNLAPMHANVPAFNGKGHLLASWTPHPKGVAGRPTVVIVHGGHGLVTTDFATAVWARDALEANTLVLDSFWSRGRHENWETYTRFGANMRMLDVIAAARWLREQGVDNDKIFLMGGSQGGWTVLRTFTDEPFMRENAKGLYRAGFSLYPVCGSKGTPWNPTLGPYWGEVLVFTGGKDSATPSDACPQRVFTQALTWTHYPLATHGWDASNRGAHSPSVDGECSRAMNVLNHFPVCRSDSSTYDMQQKIKNYVQQLLHGG
jgi:dienelactone hydrolase